MEPGSLWILLHENLHTTLLRVRRARPGTVRARPAGPVEKCRAAAAMRLQGCTWARKQPPEESKSSALARAGPTRTKLETAAGTILARPQMIRELYKDFADRNEVPIQRETDAQKTWIARIAMLNRAETRAAEKRLDS